MLTLYESSGSRRRGKNIASCGGYITKVLSIRNLAGPCSIAAGEPANSIRRKQPGKGSQLIPFAWDNLSKLNASGITRYDDNLPRGRPTEGQP